MTSRVERTKCDATRKIVQPRARLVDASVWAGLARQLRLQSREVSSLVLATLDVTHVIKYPNFTVLQVQRSYAGITVRARIYTTPGTRLARDRQTKTKSLVPSPCECCAGFKGHHSHDARGANECTLHCSCGKFSFFIPQQTKNFQQ